VALQLAGAQLRGRDLTIHLAGGGTISTAPETPLSVLDSLELIYLDQLQLILPEGPLWQPLPPRVPAQVAELNVQCKGRVVFDFTTFNLSLLEGVRIEHRWGTDEVDTFACRTLDIHLVNPFLRATGPATEQSGGAEGMKAAGIVRKVVAQGAPVEANVPSLESRLLASEIGVDLQAGTFRVRGTAPAAILEHRGFRWTGTSLEYTLDQRDPRALGRLYCRGAGELTALVAGFPLQRFRWDSAVKLVPKEGLHHLWIEGQVHGQGADGGSFSSDGLLVEIDASKNPPNVQRALAKGNVRIDLPQLEAQTDQLFVIIDHVPYDTGVAGQDGVSGQGPARRGPRLGAPTGPRMRQWLRGEPGASPVEQPVAQPVARPRPSLRGRQISALVSLRQSEVLAYDVSVEQEVLLVNPLQTVQGSLPMEFRGETLRVIHDGTSSQIQIAGQPSRIGLGDGFFEGPVVSIDGGSNRVVIDKQGTFQMPSSFIPRGNSVEVQWVAPPRCEFRGQAVFDGQSIDIGNQVRLQGKVLVGTERSEWEVAATTPHLKVMLNRGIQIVDPTSAQQAAVEMVTLRGSVQENSVQENAAQQNSVQGVEVFALQRSARGEVTGKHLLQSPRLDFFATTGELTGEGPGSYRSWIPAGNEKSPLRSISPEGTLSSTHLIYSGGIEGNLARSQIDFFHGVRVGMGIVTGWDQALDAAAMSQLQLRQGTIDCDRLRLARAPVIRSSFQPLAWEVQALGGVAFRILSERGLVSGTANRMAYDSSKDRFLLDGTPAIVQHRDLNNQPIFNASLPYFSLNARTLAIEAQVQEAILSGIQDRTRQ